MSAHHPDQTIDTEGAALLNQVRAFIRLYVVLGDAEAVAVTLWAAHTHAIEAAEATPYLDITSQQKRSGKSRLLEVFELLVARPWLTARVSPGVLVRYLASAMPTLRGSSAVSRRYRYHTTTTIAATMIARTTIGSRWSSNWCKRANS